MATYIGQITNRLNPSGLVKEPNIQGIFSGKEFNVRNWRSRESLGRMGEWRSGKTTTSTQEFTKLHNSQENAAYDLTCLKH